MHGDRFIPDPEAIRESLKPHLDYLACSALASALRPGRHTRLLPVVDFTAGSVKCVTEMRKDPILKHMLPVYLSLCYRSGLLDERGFRVSYESSRCAGVLPQSNDLIGIMMVETAKLDYADSSGFERIVLDPYFQKSLLSPQRFASLNPSNYYFLTHLVFGLTAWGNNPDRVAGMSALCDSLIVVARASLEHKYFDALAEAVIALAAIGHRGKVERAWLDALAANVHEMGYCPDARYPDPADNEDIGLFEQTYHCTLSTTVALDIFSGR